MIDWQSGINETQAVAEWVLLFLPTVLVIMWGVDLLSGWLKSGADPY